MDWFSKNLPYLLAGVSVGGQYALIAIGYTMVYGILRLINFAHGDIFMVAGLIMVYASASMPMYISIPLVLIVTVILGFLIERIAYKPLRSAPRMSIMISAIGVSYLLPEPGSVCNRWPCTAVSLNSVGQRHDPGIRCYHETCYSDYPVSDDHFGRCTGNADQIHKNRHGDACGIQGF